jgi:hypothetical protein
MLWLQKDDDGNPIYIETDIEVSLRKNRKDEVSGCDGQLLYPNGKPGYSINGSDTIPAVVKEIVQTYRFKFRPSEYKPFSRFRLICSKYPLMTTDWYPITLPDRSSAME